MDDQLKGAAAAALATICILIPAAAFAQTADMTADEAALLRAKQVPGYGGMYYDADGIAHVYLTDMSQSTALMQSATEEIKFERGRFAFNELHTYRNRMTEVMSDPNTVYLDIDERTNRVTVGVSKEAGLRRKSVDLARHFNVPPEAVVVKEVDPIYQLVGLRDRIRPSPGGMQINYPGFVCSLGFIVRQGNTNGFVTNSHCTSTQGGVENTPYWQPAQSGSNALGTEIRDPNYQFGAAGCPAGRRCRASDSALVRFSNNNAGLGQFARIARPVCANCGNLTVGNNGNRRFRITSEGSIPVGARVHKVGRTTGWTNGTHTNSCVTINVSGTNLTLTCQDLVSAGVGGGDSGSPAFQRIGGNRVRLGGVLWGGNGAGTQFVYSPLNRVRSELGNFSVR